MTNLKPQSFTSIIAGFLVITFILFNFIPTIEGTTPIYQILSDYQDYPNGGNGYLRIITFTPTQIEIRTFSPYLNQYKTGDSSNFNLDYLLNITSPFTIIALPDTQYYSSNYPHIFMNQTNWIVENKANLNIKFVTHLGDIVDNPYSSDQWYSSKDAMSQLNIYNIPYSVLPGNHDLENIDSFTSRYYLIYGPHVFTNQQTYRGSEKGDNFNNYNTFTVENENFLILSLQFNPSSSTLNWANQIIQQNPNHKVILVTHEYLNVQGRTAMGENIFNSLVKPNEIQIVLCGHYSGELAILSSLLGFPTTEGGESLKVDKI